jgi:hypothetical protein
MALTRAEKTQLGVLKTKQESSDTFGPLTPKEQKTLEELEQKQGNQSSLFDNLGIFSTAQASEINPNNPPSMLSTGAMDRETPFGDMLQPTIPSGGSIFSGREFGDIRAGKEDQGIFGGSAGQRFNMENNPELFFNTAAGQAQAEDEQNFFDYLQGLSGGVVDFGKDLTGRYIASNVGAKALGSFNPYLGAAAGIAGLFGGGDLFNTNTLSQRRFDAMTPGQQTYTSSLYGRQRDGTPGLLEGYNEISAFGQGALGTLGNRLDTIQNTLAKQGANRSSVLEQREQQIKDAIDKSINIGESEALQDPNRNVGGIRTDIDVADGGAETSGGKIVCTMMNESYGFGNFRNKIWLKHSKNLPKEYEIGYHKIFLPLVKFAKGQGKLNKAVKKTLEHVARHRTLDLKQEMKGKTHLLGRIYRKILEPICFIIGKVSNNV